MSGSRSPGSSAAPISFDTLRGVLVGWVVGAAVLVVFGGPSRRPTGASIAAGLAAVGVPLAAPRSRRASTRAARRRTSATATDGGKLFVKALGDDERSADLLFRLYRCDPPRDLGDERPFSSLRRAVEHEAFVALAADATSASARRGRRVRHRRAERRSCSPTRRSTGRSLDRSTPDELTDEVLAAIWAATRACCAQHRIAHRDLRLANVFLADDGEVWMIDFGFSELAASDLLLATDVAELDDLARVGGRCHASVAHAVARSDPTGSRRARPPPPVGAEWRDPYRDQGAARACSTTCARRCSSSRTGPDGTDRVNGKTGGITGDISRVRSYVRPA